MQQKYDDGITDEFMDPIVHTAWLSPVLEWDVFLMTNFRVDRPKQLITMLTQEPINEWAISTQPIDIRCVTMTSYNDSYTGIEILFPNENITNTLGEKISNALLTQLRAAETEKFPHVTYYFSGWQHDLFPGEDRLLVPSPKVPTYDLQPEMSVYGIADGVIAKIQKDAPDFIICNFANPDMVGHTGDFDATVKACEAVDIAMKKLIEEAKAHDYVIIVTADHGNAEIMQDSQWKPHTYHTTSPVPCIVVNNKSWVTFSWGSLIDITGFVEKLLDL